ncbi:transposase IS116/IS110/IS902 family protein [Primorskyibacter sedentarius]|uniref:Transposase IS116/IS110/IS902 family protein n=1 Tax=Primorskyibacter sedentarius TaxID=745311 RepID=A0A4R3J5S5_9RHOB|nr:transposase [Primorskyibacter sedentarius]TCS59760.1 transposase IS116/IS110/IS902 family protein [Primorskyibacter sedentarius]
MDPVWEAAPSGKHGLQQNYSDAAKKKKAHPVARRPRTIPGVGPVTELSVIALVDDPGRFSRTTDLGAYLGQTPKRYQSGEVDWSGRVPKCGNGVMRSLLFEAATTLLARVQNFTPLKSWAVRLAGQRCFAKAAVTAARKLAVLKLTMWKKETEFTWKKEAVV